MSFFEEPFTQMEIIRSERIGSHIQMVTLAFSPDKKLDFTIGCYILPEVGAGVTRAYSVAQSTDSTCTIIVSFSGMGMGARFFANSKTGTLLRVFGPYSDFPYHYNTNRPKVFLATGTGLAPFIEMIPEAIKEKLPALLIFGVARESDIPYKSYLDNLASSNDLFKTIYVLSRAGSDWEGARGHITDQLTGEREKMLQKCDIYICGVPAMVEETIKTLKRAKVPKNQIFIQKFG